MSVMEGVNNELLYSDYAVRELANVICWADTLRRYADAGESRVCRAGSHARHRREGLCVAEIE